MSSPPSRPLVLDDTLPARLRQLHRAHAVGDRITVAWRGTGGDLDGWTVEDIWTGAGFTDVERVGPGGGQTTVSATRARSLADTVGPGLRALVCGLNPSLRAAAAGIGYVTPGNRFWPAAQAAGLVSADRDPDHALAVDRVGMTDLVKRATARAAELDAGEFRSGRGRVERLVGHLRPDVVIVVGLTGWRAAVDRHAVAGPQPLELGGRPVYVLPSTSGLNAHCSLATLTAHLAAAVALGS